MNTTLDKIANPLNYYKKPVEVEQDKTLSVTEKIKLLTNWLDDINLRQIAEAENMQTQDNARTYIADVERLLHKYQIEQLGRH
ncbi:hypothetical protein [Legionella oakridgensis]|nr:hypothetical protein [Legionella oakridgensis]ETO92567.1 hypothetical protein LOR_63c16530 [Legionella oakridgensis RV-2-2007]KTD38753.1 hypothetical protein Loak_1241 [Legionella oakridgensis]STY20937.1 Uncharacterised protein [Legionella longbeachae]